jgi:carbamoyl-phosphate synthase large subunit
MKSTGEVMGIDESFGMAFAKAQTASGTILPQSGTVFISVRDRDKHDMVDIAQKLYEMGFSILATEGTARHLKSKGIIVESINKVREGSPHIVDRIKEKKVALVINTHEGKENAMDSYSIRRTALMGSIPYFTTVSAAKAAVSGIGALKSGDMKVFRLQEYQGRKQEIVRKLSVVF